MSFFKKDGMLSVLVIEPNSNYLEDLNQSDFITDQCALTRLSVWARLRVAYDFATPLMSVLEVLLLFLTSEVPFFSALDG